MWEQKVCKKQQGREADPDRTAEQQSTAIPAIGHNNPPSPIDLVDDILHGAAAIADYINVDLRRAFYLLERGYIPAVKTGATWTSTKSRLRRHFNGEAA